MWDIIKTFLVGLLALIPVLLLLLATDYILTSWPSVIDIMFGGILVSVILVLVYGIGIMLRAQFDW